MLKDTVFSLECRLNPMSPVEPSTSIQPNNTPPTALLRGEAVLDTLTKGLSLW